jgi:monoterpene epsilon-lactone hydrolase
VNNSRDRENMPSPQSRLLNSILSYVMPGGRRKMIIQERRLRTDRQAERFIHAPRGDRLEKKSIGSLCAEWHVPKGISSDRTILYLHGGAYTFCSPATHRGLAGRIAIASKARVLVIAYRLAPEHPFPAALEDSLAAWQSLLEQGVSPKNLVIAGDSAGGGLTMATAIRLRDKKVELPAALILLSPWVDLVSAKEYAKPYAGDSDPADPLISPLYANLRGLPPTLIQAGGVEFLLRDSQQLNEKMEDAKVDIHFSVYKGMNHVFQAFAPLIPESRQAIREIGEFVQGRLP